jgi:hypothetical protein
MSTAQTGRTFTGENARVAAAANPACLSDTRWSLGAERAVCFLPAGTGRGRSNAGGSASQRTDCGDAVSPVVQVLLGIAAALVIWLASVRLREHYRRKAEEKANRKFLWNTLRPGAGIFKDCDSEPPADWRPPGKW